ncbi:MAG: NupC/NupG family nucleoside CNT transporter [Woeseiaceae bacterium]|nr:NupC/NupG family nucleoside CNT transporter [Woeseiaceae bacterium]NIP21910.1 NupC/NupG family nucleoside CNT transporter [Woeseiaceae bacterium]NIS90995.1 NupC/NupG family nucleoside CNT transporter [Woeseiaceae bacterium]
MTILVSIAGVLAMLGIGWLLSTNRAAINRRTVLVAVAIQSGIAALVLYVPQGGQALNAAVRAVQHVINYAKDGIRFVFGENFEQNLGFTVALNVLPVIVFIGAMMSVLYYLGIMQRVVGTLGGWLHKLLGTSQPESISAVSNIFVGHTDAPLVIRPYLKDMTQSELFAVMVGGCATIASAVMMGFAQLGVDLKYLITASFMAAPGGLLMAKIMMPETEQRQIAFDPKYTGDEDPPVNIFEAIGNGAMTGLQVALSVGAMLVAFVAIVAVINGILTGIGGWFGMEGLTLQWLLGKLFFPVALVIGVPWGEAAEAGSLIGQKLVINEFYAYVNFVGIKETLSPQTQLVVTFALCGFANLSSIAILLGGLGAIVPERRHDIARLGLRAVIGGTLVNLMNASLAGLFFALQAA